MQRLNCVVYWPVISAEPINIFHGSYETDLPPIRLSYHRSNHYNSLLDPCNPAVGAGLGFGSLRGVGISFFSVLLRNPKECFLSSNYVASSSTKVVTIFLFNPPLVLLCSSNSTNVGEGSSVTLL